MKKKPKLTTLLLALIFLVGLSLLLYPTFSNWWNSFHSSQAISSYAENVESMNRETYDQVLADAHAYNDALANKSLQYFMTESDLQAYNAQLDVSGIGMMGYVEIPSIDCKIPIYHGTSDSVLQFAAGHLEWTSLPVGGASTHCVLSGHRGLPSARLFTDLDKMKEKDLFMLHVLNETFTYEVDRILIVEPEDTSALQIEKGEDYCTLVTCTPYGINTHRMLVRGHRVENQKNLRVEGEANRLDPTLVSAVLAIPILLALLIFLLVRTRKKKNH